MRAQFFGNCLLHAIAGCGLGVVVDSAFERYFKHLVRKSTLHPHLARAFVIGLQLFTFVFIAALEVVYVPNSKNDHKSTVASMFFEMLLFSSQFSFFEKIQTLTADV
jgi:hypothetical protein